MESVDVTVIRVPPLPAKHAGELLLGMLGTRVVDERKISAGRTFLPAEMSRFVRRKSCRGAAPVLCLLLLSNLPGR